MSNHINTSKIRKTLGLVYDVPTHLENSPGIEFPPDATAEWENKITIDTIVHTWQSLGFVVLRFPLDHSFFKNWENNARSCDLIHSIVEGFGSLARESWIPSLCELSGIPYIGSSPYAQSLCMNKAHLKQICLGLNVPTAPFYLVQCWDDFLKIPTSFFQESHFIKPNGEGSGMGIHASFSIGQSKSETEHKVREFLPKYLEGILLEKYLSGDEYTSAMIGTPPQFLPVAQIQVHDGVYGLANKRKDVMEEKISFPILNSKVKKTMEEGTIKLFTSLPLNDFVRMDWKCDDDGNVYFLEANALAGLSFHYSVLPLMAKEAGMNYKEFFQCLFDSAMCRAQGRHLWYGKTRLRKKK